MSRHPEGPHRGGLVDVLHEHRVGPWHDEHVAVRDRLDVHEGDDAVVLVDEAGGGFALDDRAEDAVVTQAEGKLKRALLDW